MITLIYLRRRTIAGRLGNSSWALRKLVESTTDVCKVFLLHGFNKASNNP
jgi:hypothetical protein